MKAFAIIIGILLTGCSSLPTPSRTVANEESLYERYHSQEFPVGYQTLNAEQKNRTSFLIKGFSNSPRSSDLITSIEARRGFLNLIYFEQGDTVCEYTYTVNIVEPLRVNDTTYYQGFGQIKCPNQEDQLLVRELKIKEVERCGPTGVVIPTRNPSFWQRLHPDRRYVYQQHCNKVKALVLESDRFIIVDKKLRE